MAPLRVQARVRGTAVVLAFMACLSFSGVAAQDPSPSVSAAPTETPPPERVGFEPIPMLPGAGTAPGGLPWRQVDAALPATDGMGDLTAWAGGFAAVEYAAGRRPVAVWHSTDGIDWTRSALPAAVTEVWRLVPAGDALVIASASEALPRDRVHVRLWRSTDAATWDPAGSFHTRLRGANRADWVVSAADLRAVGGRLVLWTSRTRFQAGSGGWLQDGPGLAGHVALALTDVGRPEEMTAWDSRDGTHWRPQRVRGDTTSGTASLRIFDAGPRGLIGVISGWDQDEGRQTVVRSVDGIRWTRVAAVPEQWDSSGPTTLVWTGDSVLAAADNADEVGAVGCGNRLGVWKLQSDGAWELVADRQAAVVYDIAVDGDAVIATGQGWCTAPDWGWTLVSLDGGRTWDPDLSWTGAPGTCVGDVVARDGTAVMTGCADGDPSLWVAPLPAAPGPADPSPSPSVSPAP